MDVGNLQNCEKPAINPHRQENCRDSLSQIAQPQFKMPQICHQNKMPHLHSIPQNPQMQFAISQLSQLSQMPQLTQISLNRFETPYYSQGHQEQKRISQHQVPPQQKIQQHQWSNQSIKQTKHIH